MTPSFFPSLLLRAFQSVRIPRKLGLGEMLWAGALARRGITWVDFGKLRWKLNLANDTHRWLVYGEYEEPALRRLLERIIDDQSILIDSGANIGQMVLVYLVCAAPAMIHAFEPLPEARRWLCDCIKVNQLTNVLAWPQALRDKVSTAHLTPSDFTFKEGSSSRLNFSGLGISVDVTTLDAFASQKSIHSIRFWKLDVEGQELPALRGATNLLERSGIDYLYVETADAGSSIESFLSEFAYLPVTFELDRVLRPGEACRNFTNVFVSARVALEECHLSEAS